MSMIINPAKVAELAATMDPYPIMSQLTQISSLGMGVDLNGLTQPAGGELAGVLNPGGASTPFGAGGMDKMMQSFQPKAPAAMPIPGHASMPKLPPINLPVPGQMPGVPTLEQILGRK